MATPKAQEPQGATVVGPTILVRGRLTGDEDLTVQGRVEGEVTLTRTLVVEATGVLKANVAVKNAIISGVVVGNVNATESVELTREGRMVGDIRAPRVILVDGASFRGRVEMGEVEPGRVPSERPVVARPAPRTATPPRPPPPPRGAPVTPPRGTASAGKPLPPPPPPGREAGAPAPVVVGQGGKKKFLLKKRGR